MTTSVVVVGCGFPQLGLLGAAKRLGLHVIGLDLNPEAVGVPLVDTFVRASTGDAGQVASAVQRSGARALTTTGSELALTTTAAVADRLGLPFYADPATVFRCQDKGAMREAYASARLPVPRFLHVRTWPEASTFADSLPLPLVVKPASGWGQRGVSRVDHRDELEKAYQRAAEASHNDAGVVIEEFMAGHELSVNGWVEDGELVVYAVTDREVFAGTAPLGVMRSEVVPSRVDAALVASGVEAARAAARSLGLERGPCYTQVCVAPGRAAVFETAARCGGGFDADVTKLVSGVDLYRRLLGVALGDRDLEREGVTGERHTAALVRFVSPPRGVVRTVSGLDEARGCPGVVDAAIYPRPGQTLAGLVNAASRAAHLLVVGGSRDEAVARADEAEKRLVIEVQ